MKNLLFIFLVLIGFSINAQEWHTNIDTAKKIAAANNQHIVLVFSGSDWCGPCKKLEQQIWSSEEFKNYAKDHLVMLKADFPRRKKNKLSKEQQEHNNMLAEKYDARFPLIVTLNSEGNVLGRIGYKNYTPTEYIEYLKSIE